MRDRINWTLVLLWSLAIAAIAIGTAGKYHGQ